MISYENNFPVSFPWEVLSPVPGWGFTPNLAGPRMIGVGDMEAAMLGLAFYGLGAETAPQAITTPPETAGAAFGAFFDVVGGLTFANAQATKAMAGIWTPALMAATPASEMQLAGGSIGILVHAGQGIQAGQTTMADLLSKYLTTAGVVLTDKMFLAPTPGDRTIVIANDAQTIATMAKNGGSHFLTQGATGPLIDAAKKLASGGPFAVLAGVGFLPLAIGGVAVAALLGVLFSSGKKRRG